MNTQAYGIMMMKTKHVWERGSGSLTFTWNMGIHTNSEGKQGKKQANFSFSTCCYYSYFAFWHACLLGKKWWGTDRHTQAKKQTSLYFAVNAAFCAN